MANIYLRVPEMIAAFCRNKFATPLRKDQPWEFGRYDIKRTILEDGLRVLYGNKGNELAWCYSEQQWKNMMQGRSPDGGKRILNRDKTEWLTFDEVRVLVGAPLDKKSEHYDYLCIKLPATFAVDGVRRHSNSGYSLLLTNAKELNVMLLADFRIALAEWEKANRLYALQPHGSGNIALERSRRDMVERFCLHYDLPGTRDGQEMGTIRKMILRASEDLKIPDCIDISYEDKKDKRISMR